MKIAELCRRTRRIQLRLASRTSPALGIVLVLAGNAAHAQTEVRAGAESGAEPQTIMMDMVEKKAKKLSEKAYQARKNTVPEGLSKLNYDQYRAIRFKAEHALWRDQGMFEIQLLPPGFIYKETVEINQVNQKQASHPVPFRSTYFSYDDKAAREFAQKADKKSGYSGFRVHFPLNAVDYKDEVAVFQGASYFRLVGPGQVYGISARGLAIDTAEASGEEFPRFTEFWLLQPTPQSNQLTIFALLDSPSVSGAYRIRISASTATIAEVDAVLFPREDIKKVGIAPLTSMFLFGESRLRFNDDIRHEVHDSDGLLLHTSDDQWIWRPLSNPRSLQVTSLLDRNPRGFGLLQRDRDFDHYLDIEARYEDRPGLWVKPQGDWGEGRVELVEIPTEKETNDNIVAYWVPREGFVAGKEYRISYSLSTIDSIIGKRSLAKVVRTLVGWGALPGEHDPPPRSVRQFAIDFSGSVANNLTSGVPVQAALESSAGKVSDVVVKRLPGEHGWRAAFRLRPEENVPSDLSLYLHLRGKRISEEWSYVWSPGAIDE